MTENYYDILGVGRNATEDEIRYAFRRSAKKSHPDLNPDNRIAAEVQMKRLNAAYETLRDPRLRRDYDFELSRAEEQMRCRCRKEKEAEKRADEEVFRKEDRQRAEEMRRRAKDRTKRERRGADIYINIDISLEEAFSGIRREIRYERRRRCRYCRGTGKLFGSPHASCGASGFQCESLGVVVSVPGGVSHGMKLRNADGGHEGKTEDIFGDLYVVVRIAVHAVFRRTGNDLTRDVFVAKGTAVRGGEIETRSIDGKTIRIRVPAGTTDGTQFCCVGYGMSTLDGGRGDFYVRVNVLPEKKRSVEKPKRSEPKVPPPSNRGMPKSSPSHGFGDVGGEPKWSPNFNAAWEAAGHGETPNDKTFPGLSPKEKKMISLYLEILQKNKILKSFARAGAVPETYSSAPPPKTVTEPLLGFFVRACLCFKTFFAGDNPVASWRRRRDIYTFLAGTLGVFGVHNFYAGNLVSGLFELSTYCFVRANLHHWAVMFVFWGVMFLEGYLREDFRGGVSLKGNAMAGAKAAIAILALYYVVSCQVG